MRECENCRHQWHEADDPAEVELVDSAELAALRAVEVAARDWFDCVDQGFANPLRPDIARMRVQRALQALDKARAT